jgi:hypothetical protein
MPWRCPACATQIRHSPIEEMPRPGHRYRCHICRLELVIDQSTNKLTIAPFDEPGAPSPKPRTKT